MLSRSMSLGFLLLVGVLAMGCGPTTFVVGLSPGDMTLKKTVVEEAQGRTRNEVAMVDVTGMIMNARQDGLLSQGENPVSTFSEKLDKAAEDNDVKAVILRINSPGGGVTASEIMYRELVDFRAQTGKPVVVLMMDVAASGGYFLACAGDAIVAYPSTVTGSIGVIIQTVNFHKALTSIGIEPEAITSGPNKAVGSPLEPMSDGQRAILQGLVDEFYAGFVQVVRESRPGLTDEAAERATDGRVVSGAQAYELGLVDQLGGLDHAFEMAKSLASIDDADLVLYHRPLEYVASPYASSPVPGLGGGGHINAGTQVNLLQLNMDGSMGGLNIPPGFYYLWRP
ncbi:MAG: signal peptide peptidase SppA [Planctomycetota bacterium]